MGLFGKRTKTKSADGTKTVVSTSNKGQRLKTKQVSPSGAKSKNVSVTKENKLSSLSRTKNVTSGAGNPRSVTKKYNIEDRGFGGTETYTGTKTNSSGTRSKESCYSNPCTTESKSKSKSFSSSGKKVKNKSFKITNK